MLGFLKINFVKIIIFIIVGLVLFISAYFLLGKYQESESERKLELQYILANQEMEKGNYSEAIVKLESMSDYKDSDQLLKKAKYNYAIELYSNKDFETSKIKFEELGDYEDSLEYLNKIPQDLLVYNFLKDYIGKWTTSYIVHIIDGSLNVTQYVDVDGQYNRLSILRCSLENNSLICPSLDVTTNPNPTIFDFKDGIVYWSRELVPSESSYLYENVDTYFELKKITSNTELPPPLSPSEYPRIAMTKDEARNSTWGEPQKINRTTTKYGTSEQWVYDDYKYLYFDEDGYLTTIQD